MEHESGSEWNIFLASVSTFGELYHDILLSYAAICNGEEIALALLKGNMRAMLSILRPYIGSEEKGRIEKLMIKHWNDVDSINLIHIFEDEILTHALNYDFLPKKIEGISDLERLKKDKL